jgi:hypothetical protein
VQRTDEVAEQGTVPPDRVGRIIEGVLRRLEEPETPDVRDTGATRAAGPSCWPSWRGVALDPPYQE